MPYLRNMTVSVVLEAILGKGKIFKVNKTI